MTGPADDPRLDALVDLIVELASGDLSVRMEPSPARDTIDAVITGFNMLATELSDVYEDFESRVAERTGRLEQVQKELERLALEDGLTGLANRTLFVDRVNQAIQLAQHGALPPAVVVLDLDGFKTINDSLGHIAGDAILVEVARRLSSVVRETDTVARLGGDEFAIVVPHVTAGGAMEIAERALAVLDSPIPLAGRAVWARASIGVRQGGPGRTADILLRDADTAMYVAKAKGRGNIQVYEPTMHLAVQERLQVVTDLRSGIPAGQLALLYQPIVSLNDGAIVAAEALVRWNHPTRGLVPPDQFITIAEDSGLIIELGRWVASEATKQLAAWGGIVADRPDFRVHLNVSPVEVRRPGLAEHIQGSLAESGVAADRLVLEIAESGVMTGDPNERRVLEGLRELGVSLSIDDFGTGYSSIAYLRRLPVSMVKVDRSLIAGIDTDARQWDFVGAILRLIESAGLAAVVEGIESAVEADRLRELGAALGQGYHFSRPVDADEFAQMLVPGIILGRATARDGRR